MQQGGCNPICRGSVGAIESCRTEHHNRRKKRSLPPRNVVHHAGSTLIGKVTFLILLDSEGSRADADQHSTSPQHLTSAIVSTYCLVDTEEASTIQRSHLQNLSKQIRWSSPEGYVRRRATTRRDDIFSTTNPNRVRVARRPRQLGYRPLAANWTRARHRQRQNVSRSARLVA